MIPLTFLALLAAADPAPVPADIVLKGGTVYDGSGQPGVGGDVAIKDDRIVAVGRVAVTGNPKVIDCTGLIVAPGLIDLHTHSDNGAIQASATRQNLSYLTQGVTTIVTGNCGSGPINVGAFYALIEKNGIGSNVAHLVPHNSVREKVTGNVNRVPTAAEMDKMKDLVDRGMRDGAWGLSTGLIYNPGTYAKTAEIIELAKVAARHGGIYASHIRHEEAGLLDAIQEAITIGKEAGLPAHISHIKCSGRRMWGKSGDAIALIEAARAAGQVVTADQYPYTASSTSLRAMVVPTQYREGSTQDFRDRLADPELGPKIRAAIEREVADRDNGKALRVCSCSSYPAYAGRDLAAIAAQEQKPVVDIVVAIEKGGGAQMVSFGMSEEDVRIFMRRPWVATASDGTSKVPSADMPHPRSYGTFPRKIGRYCIEEQVLPLEQAIRSASGLPADIIRLPERGYLKAGCFADVVVFDPKAFRDTATYDKPHQFAPGVKWLYVNGTAAIADGKPTSALAGRVLRHEELPPGNGRP
jgi:N-acyl-D-aspartate/D-glutamate deacylase